MTRSESGKGEGKLNNSRGEVVSSAVTSLLLLLLLLSGRRLKSQQHAHHGRGRVEQENKEKAGKQGLGEVERRMVVLSAAVVGGGFGSATDRHSAQDVQIKARSDWAGVGVGVGGDGGGGVFVTCRGGR